MGIHFLLIVSRLVMHMRVYTNVSMRGLRRDGVSCAAVDAVATLIAAGQQGPEVGFIKVKRLDESGNPIPEKPPSIEVWPFNETLEQFLDRARRRYKEVLNWYRQRGFKGVPLKRSAITLAQWLRGSRSHHLPGE